MTPQITVLLDTPTLTPATNDDTSPVSRHPIAKLGRYKDPRYGTFSITEKDFQSWQKNLAAKQNGKLAIDYDHLAEKPGGTTKAAGWITSLELEGDKVVANIEWTPEGAQNVRDKYYQFVSPSFVNDYKDEQQRSHGPALLGVALTNRPFLRDGMPAINLSASTFAEFAELDPVTETNDAPDTHGQMSELTEFTTQLADALQLSDANTDSIVEAVTELQAKTSDIDARTLNERAQEEGKILLNQDDYRELQENAAKGVEALTALNTQKFEQAFELALSEGRVNAADETKERFRKLYDLDADTTLATLAELPQAVSLEASKGKGPGTTPAAPEGVIPESHELNQKVEAYQAEHDVDFITALNAVAASERTEF